MKTTETLIRYDWTLEEIKAYYHQPILELVYQSATVHRRFHDPLKVQVCHLISVKTGGCPENCFYCAQSSRNQTGIRAESLMTVEDVLSRAKWAIERGATRICLGAAWRNVRPNKPFEEILKMVEGIATMGAEVCCTLGMLEHPEAARLAQAGAYAYNHNLDTSQAYYSKITTTRTYQDRLNTLDVVEENDLSLCCGGIIGMGESIDDRLSLLHTLATRKRHPDSVPINLLEAITGTPLENQPPVPFWEFLRTIATARRLMPQAKVRLSAGRRKLSKVEHALCFFAGANSLFSGEKLLTVPNSDPDDDDILLELLGLEKETIC